MAEFKLNYIHKKQYRTNIENNIKMVYQVHNVILNNEIDEILENLKSILYKKDIIVFAKGYIGIVLLSEDVDDKNNITFQFKIVYGKTSLNTTNEMSQLMLQNDCKLTIITHPHLVYNCHHVLKKIIRNIRLLIRRSYNRLYLYPNSKILNYTYFKNNALFTKLLKDETLTDAEKVTQYHLNVEDFKLENISSYINCDLSQDSVLTIRVFDHLIKTQAKYDPQMKIQDNIKSTLSQTIDQYRCIQ